MNLLMGGLFLLIAVPTMTQRQENRKKLPGAENDVTGHSNGTKTRRSLTKLTWLGKAGLAAWRGIKGTSTLLKGATKLRHQGSIYQMYQMYRKKGDYNTALTDFLLVQPTNVEDVSFGKRGIIGDRVVKVRKGLSNNSPYIVIQKLKNTSIKPIMIEYRSPGQF